jgi:CRISPR-associated protein Csb1
VALRGLHGENLKESEALRNYLLSLALIAATAEMDLFLREGCHLRYTGDDKWVSVPRRGESEEVNLASDEAAKIFKAAAEEGATHFRSKWPKEWNYTFDIAEAKKLLATKEEDDQAPV